MKAFVTGGTGLLGINLIRALRWEGHRVKALVRSMEKAGRVLNDTGISYVAGDMRNVDAWANELQGCDAVFHAASSRSTDLHQTNVKGTVHLLLQAQRHRVSKAVYFSSALLQENPADDAVRRYVFHNDYPVTTIQPGWMLGPGDVSRNPAGQLIERLIRQMPVDLGGAANLVDARDVALGALSAAAPEHDGHTYLLGGHYAPFSELVCESLPAPRGSLLTHLFRKSLSGAKVSSALGLERLQLSFRPLEETVRDTVDWYLQRDGESMVA